MANEDFVQEWKKLWEEDLEAIAYNGATCDPTRVDPKVLQWVKNNCARQPHFIKVINDSSAYGWLPPFGARGHGRQQCRLTVPCPFVREHYRALGRVVVLENGRNHKTWKVSFGAPRKLATWLQGWKCLAVENELTTGDVMVFVLVGHSHFVFHLFDEYGHPKLQFHNPKVETKPTSTSFQEHNSRMDSEYNLRNVKKRKLFESRNVKREPECPETTDQPSATSLKGANFWYEDPRDEEYEAFRYSELPVEEKSFSGTARWTEATDLQSSDAPKKVNRKLKLQNFETTQAKPVKPLIPVKILKPVKQVKILKPAKVDIDGIVSHDREVPSKVQELPLDPVALFIKSRRRRPTYVERKRAKDVAQAHGELLLGHRFLVTLSDAQAYEDFNVLFPERFVLESKLPKTRTRWDLMDSNGKVWEMFTRMNSRGQIAFDRKYWCAFSLEHRMEEGDVCLFQLKGTISFTISVRIFRVLQLQKPGGKNVPIHDHYDLQVKNFHKS